MTRHLPWACVLAALLLPAIADAHRSSSSRVHNSRHIAEAKWGAGNCVVSPTDLTPVRIMNIPLKSSPGGIVVRDKLTEFSGVFRSEQVPGSTVYDEQGQPIPGTTLHHRCLVELDGRERRTTSQTCRLLAHEFGHADDRGHNLTDPTNIMYGYGLPAFWAPCENNAASTRNRRPLPPPLAEAPSPAPPATAPTVLLLHGGGWRSGHPNGMEPQAADLRAHGINARSIAYPFGSVARALEHVQRVAAQESPPVVLYGISAGGTLAAALAASGDVDGGINVSGPTDFPNWITPSGLELKHKLRISRAEQFAVSPIHRLNGRQTPQLVQCGVADPLVDYPTQCVRYHRKARAGNADTTLQQTIAHGQALDDHARARAWIQTRWP